MKTPKTFAIAGWKNSGKTSLVGGLVRELGSRGLLVSTIKHAHHSFDLDTPGTDSFSHREAGAKEVVLVSASRWAIQHELVDEKEPALSEMLERLAPCDVVLIEGYKREAVPKLEIIGPDSNQDFLWKNDPNVVALAADKEIEECSLPQFSRNDYTQIADFIVSFHRLNP